MSRLNRRDFGALLGAAALPAWSAEDRARYATRADLELARQTAARERDWRIGAISYQVLVDRFAPSRRLDAKRALYPSPKRLRDWSEQPARGSYLESHKLWSHEIDFWGGDLDSLAARLDYVQALGADVLYLNPIHLAYTNHKYDALDYAQVSPEYGTRADVKRLAADLHRRGMKLVLDGVFNHMGRNAPIFRAAEADPKSKYRNWFVFGKEYPGGARIWTDAQNLVELNLENPAVRAHVYGAPDSVVRGYLRDGVDGWRLDVAFDIGFSFLEELTRAAHAQQPGSLVVGEIANYPRDWFPAVDGVLGFTLRRLLLAIAAGQLAAPQAQALLSRMIDEAGVENMLRSWIYLDNHDTARLATSLPDMAQRRLAQLLQFTLPGAPNLYYGSELGMAGADDPEMRGPMRWDWVREDNEVLRFTRQLIALRKSQRALRLGNYRRIDAQQLLAFERYTERAADSVIVVINASDTEQRETLLIPDSKLMDGTRLNDLLGGPPQRLQAALLTLAVPARSALLLSPATEPHKGYTNYKRVL